MRLNGVCGIDSMLKVISHFKSFWITSRINMN